MTDDTAHQGAPGAGLTDWLTERRDNSRRIAGEKTGADRRGWLEDAAYFQAALDTAAERDRFQKTCDRLTDWMAGKGWSHCTTEDELMEQVDDIEAERDRLKVALQAIVRDAPVTKPMCRSDWSEPEKMREYARDYEHWRLALIARTALDQAKEGAGT